MTQSAAAERTNHAMVGCLPPLQNRFDNIRRKQQEEFNSETASIGSTSCRLARSSQESGVLMSEVRLAKEDQFQARSAGSDLGIASESAS
jgi:hypothetical protein